MQKEKLIPSDLFFLFPRFVHILLFNIFPLQYFFTIAISWLSFHMLFKWNEHWINLWRSAKRWNKSWNMFARIRSRKPVRHRTSFEVALDTFRPSDKHALFGVRSSWNLPFATVLPPSGSTFSKPFALLLIAWNSIKQRPTSTTALRLDSSRVFLVFSVAVTKKK